MSQTSEKTIIGTILVDRSGSMKLILPTLLKSLHSFIDEIKECSKQATFNYFRLSTFSVVRHTIFPIYEEEMFGDINTLNKEDVDFHTYGCTKLIDSAIQEADILNKKLDELSNEDTMSWFVLLTDGEDNLSNTSHTVLHDKIKALKERGVSCIFMGANIDAIKTGIDFGFEEKHSLQVDLNVNQSIDSAPLVNGFRAVSDNITQSFYDDTYDTSFSTLQRTSSAPSMHDNMDMYMDMDMYNDDEINMMPPPLRRSSNLDDIPLNIMSALEEDEDDLLSVSIEDHEFEKMIESFSEL